MRTKSRNPKKRQDEQEFPIRVRVLTPELGYGKQYEDMYKRLEEHVGRGNFACHSDTLPGADASADYFKKEGFV